MCIDPPRPSLVGIINFFLPHSHHLVTVGALAAGTTLGWTAQINDRKVLLDEGEISVEEFGWTGSSLAIGAAVICLFIGTIMQRFGRKPTMLALIIPFTIGWVLVTFAKHVAMIYVGRFLLGVSGGAFCVSAPMYTAEIARADIRGTLGTFFQLMLVIGILLVYILGAYVDLRIMNMICTMIPWIFGACFMWMPESPLYLVSKGRNVEAAKSLNWLRGNNYDLSTELEALRQQHAEETANKVSFRAAMQRPATKKATLICFGLMFFQQMSGINAVIFYSGDIFEKGRANIGRPQLTIIVGVIQVIAVFLSSLTVDRVGRRWLLLSSIATMGVCMTVLGVYFKAEDEIDSTFDFIPLVAICVFIALFSFGFGPVPWMMMGELVANDIKGVVASMAGAFNWILVFSVTSSFGSLNSAFGKGPAFWIFAGFCVIGIFFVIFTVPETKGKTLQEIQIMLGEEERQKIEQSPTTG